VSETAGGRTAPRAPAAPSNWNLANGLTLLRLLLVPFFVWLLLEEGGEEPKGHPTTIRSAPAAASLALRARTR